MSEPQSPGRRATAPRLVVVVGSGRSGTSTLAGVLKQLGMHVPQPEWPPNKTNPRGFYEPKWVVQFQRRLLRRANVALDDARPIAFEHAARAASRPQAQRELARWLAEHALVTDENIVKDPRNSWFIPMWRAAAEQAGGVPSFVTTLRHPAEVVGSKSTYYGDRFGAGSRTANWLNIALHTEEATRQSPRSFVRYGDLLQDWRTQVARIAGGLDLAVMERASAEQQAQVDAFVDPDLRRVQATWQDLDVPDRLRDMAESVWEQLGRLAVSPSGRDGDAERVLDAARKEYRDFYEEAEAAAQSSVVAAHEQGRRSARSGTGAPDRGAAQGGAGGRLGALRRPLKGRRAQREG